MDIILYFLQSVSKFLRVVVNLLNCGNSLATFLPTVLYIIGCLLTCYTICVCYSHYASQDQMKILLLKLGLYGSLLWMGVVSLAKIAASMLTKQCAEDKIKYIEFKVVRLTMIFCSLVAVLPNVVALYLYIRYRQHQRLLEQFNDLIRSIEDNHTEFGSTNQIQEVSILERRAQSYFSKIHQRSCPNLFKRF